MIVGKLILILIFYLGEYAEKKSGKSAVFCQTRGGVSEGKQKTKPQVWGLKKGQKWPKMA